MDKYRINSLLLDNGAMGKNDIMHDASLAE